MHSYFSTSPVFSPPSDGIDRTSGTIKGVTIAQLGLAKGHAGYIDKTFLLQIVENAATKPAGIKARFGHPNMCSTALGSYLGRFKNYSYTGDKVKADLFLDDTARKTPGGDLYSYVFDMAEKNPDMFGASIVFSISDSEIIEETVDNKKVKKEYFRLAELMATDLVDSPAATDSLFSTNTFPGIATQFLDENPEILDIIFSKPDSLIEFLSNYLTNSKMNLSDKIKENFSVFMAKFSVQPESEPLLPHPEMQEPVLNALFEKLTATFPESFSSVENLSQEQKAELILFCMTKLTEQILKTVESFDSLNAEHQELKQQLKKGLADLDSERSRSELLTEQLSARPSIPLNVTDPSISLSTNQEKDETGKQILAALPKDMKRKLAAASKPT